MTAETTLGALEIFDLLEEMHISCTKIECADLMGRLVGEDKESITEAKLTEYIDGCLSNRSMWQSFFEKLGVCQRRNLCARVTSTIHVDHAGIITIKTLHDTLGRECALIMAQHVEIPADGNIHIKSIVDFILQNVAWERTRRRTTVLLVQLLSKRDGSKTFESQTDAERDNNCTMLTSVVPGGPP